MMQHRKKQQLRLLRVSEKIDKKGETMKFLNRSEAPLSQELWDMIDTITMDHLANRLKIRSVLDFNEAYGFDTDAIATGKLQKVSSKDGVDIAVREPIAMKEIRHHFSVSKETLEDMKRDIDDADDAAFRKAANVFAAAENTLILEGLKEAKEKGLLDSLSQKALSAKGAKALMVAVAKSQQMFNDEFVDGPFKLVVSYETMSELVIESEGGETMKQKIEKILGADSIVVTDAIGDDKALIISQRGGDFVFYSGLDVAIGYETETADSLNFFLLETCAFRVIAPEAALQINLK